MIVKLDCVFVITVCSTCNSKKKLIFVVLDLNIINLNDIDVQYPLFYDQIFISIIHKNMSQVGRLCSKQF